MIPERLSDADRDSLRAWAARRCPSRVDHLLEAEDDCLIWHRSLRSGDKRTKRASWYATVQNWVRKEAETVAKVGSRGRQDDVRSLLLSGAPSQAERAENAAQARAIRERLAARRIGKTAAAVREVADAIGVEVPQEFQPPPEEVPSPRTLPKPLEEAIQAVLFDEIV